jgi:hypothetical protein
MIRTFIGYDPREEVVMHVLAGSILRRSSQPVAIAPIALSNLKEVFDRPRDPKQSTDFPSAVSWRREFLRRPDLPPGAEDRARPRRRRGAAARRRPHRPVRVFDNSR